IDSPEGRSLASQELPRRGRTGRSTPTHLLQTDGLCPGIAWQPRSSVRDCHGPASPPWLSGTGGPASPILGDRPPESKRTHPHRDNSVGDQPEGEPRGRGRVPGGSPPAGRLAVGAWASYYCARATSVAQP